MGLDIRISRAKPIYCPHCGELVTYQAVDTVDGGGSLWYEFLESIDYYKLYGEDMALNDEQVGELLKFVNRPDFDGLWQIEQTSWLIESARIDGDKIVINADW